MAVMLAGEKKRERDSEITFYLLGQDISDVYLQFGFTLGSDVSRSGAAAAQGF